MDLTRRKAIRLKCLDCCGGSCADVRRCTVTSCPLFLYRLGKQIPGNNREANINSTKPCYVYFVTDGEKVKIGISEDVEKRLSGLQVSNHKALSLIAAHRFPNRDCARKKEIQLHEQYKDFSCGGEWFDILNTLMR